MTRGRACASMDIALRPFFIGRASPRRSRSGNFAGVNGQFRTNQVTKAAMHTCAPHPFGHNGIVIALGIDLIRVHQYLGWAVGDTEIALFATLGDDMHAPNGNLGQRQGQWVANHIPGGFRQNSSSLAPVTQPPVALLPPGRFYSSATLFRMETQFCTGFPQCGLRQSATRINGLIGGEE